MIIIRNLPTTRTGTDSPTQHSNYPHQAKSTAKKKKEKKRHTWSHTCTHHNGRHLRSKGVVVSRTCREVSVSPTIKYSAVQLEYLTTITKPDNLPQYVDDHCDCVGSEVGASPLPKHSNKTQKENPSVYIITMDQGYEVVTF